MRPYLNVEPRKYRFRILNASNARFWNLTLAGGPPAWQIGSDGGLFDRPVALDGPLLMLPAERMDVIVDFSGFAGRTLTVSNADLPADVSSPAPPLADVMEIRVGRTVTRKDPKLPASLPGTMPALGAPSLARNITLEEVENPTTGEPEYGSLNGRKFDDVRGVQERPKAGSTEDWRLVTERPPPRAARAARRCARSGATSAPSSRSARRSCSSPRSSSPNSRAAHDKWPRTQVPTPPGGR